MILQNRQQITMRKWVREQADLMINTERVAVLDLCSFLPLPSLLVNFIKFTGMVSILLRNNTLGTSKVLIDNTLFFKRSSWTYLQIGRMLSLTYIAKKSLKICKGNFIIQFKREKERETMSRVFPMVQSFIIHLLSKQLSADQEQGAIVDQDTKMKKIWCDITVQGLRGPTMTSQVRNIAWPLKN